MDKVEKTLNKKLLFMACGGALLASGGIYYYLKSKSSNDFSSDYSRDEIMKILKKFKRNYYPIFKTLTIAYKQLTEKYLKQYGIIPEHFKRNMYNVLITSNPKFNELATKLEDEVYSEFNITDRKKFEETVQSLSKNDIEMKKIQQDIQDELINITKGGSISLQIEIKDHITPELTFKVYKELIYSVLIQLNDFLVDYIKQNGSFNLNSGDFMMKFGQAIKPNKIRKELFCVNQFDYSDVYHENMIFDSMVDRFLKTDSRYSEIIKEMRVFEQDMLNKHLLPNQDYSELRGKIEEIKGFDVKKDEEAKLGKIVEDDQIKENKI
jgi:hypothetical protein